MFDNLQKKQEGVDDIFADTEPVNPSAENKKQQMASDPVNISPKSNAIPQSKLSEDKNFDLEFVGSGGDKKSSIIKKLFIIIIIFVLVGAGAYFVYSQFLLPSSIEKNQVVLNESDNLVATEDDQDSFVDDLEEDNMSDDFLFDDFEGGFEDSSENNDFFDNSNNIIEDNDATEDNFDSDSLLKNLDSDGDGINDYDEMYVYMTDTRNPDTDTDGLTDWEEVFIFGTDPLNSDSDSDTYSDGSEVMNCYNPLGTGVIDYSLFVDSNLFLDRFPNLIDQCNL